MMTHENSRSRDRVGANGRVNPREIRCETCGIRKLAEANPDSIMSKVWKWHTGWCPGWSAYQKALAGAAE
jgi:hypothetical protein